MSKEISTEEKIKSAAKTIFLKKGYAGTRTRDIAEEAGINLALLNYYYRSKEKLFNEIMSETLFTFLSSIVSIYNDTNTSLEEKLQNLTSSYIDQIIEQPEIPVFVLSELRANPDKFMSIMAKTENLQDSVLFQQIQAHLDEKGIKENPIHMLLNTMGMILFPFIATPLLKRITHVDDEQFKMLMHERKKMITNWIMKIMT